MNRSAIPQLDYAPPRRSRGRWFKRIFLAALILSNVYFAFDKWGQGIRLQIRMLIAQRRCMACSLPPTRIILDTEPSRASALLMQGYGQPLSIFEPNNPNPVAVYPQITSTFKAFDEVSNILDIWRNPPAPNGSTVSGGIFADPPSTSSGSDVFLHERRSPSGHVRLIQSRASVSVDEGYLDNPSSYSIQLSASAIEPASLTGLRKWCEPNPPSRPLPLLRPGDQRWLRLFAGQPDPDDASRFTIRYETTNGAGLIEGALADDDVVQLRTLSGPLPTLLLGPASAPADAEK